MSLSSSSSSNQDPYNYSHIPTLNTLLNEEKLDKIEERNTDFEKWLNNIPADFRKPIHQEIFLTAKKFLSKKLNSNPAFFNALPYYSLLKTTLCFSYYLSCPNPDIFLEQMENLPEEPETLQQAIEAFIKFFYLYEIFRATEYCLKESPAILSLINPSKREAYEVDFLENQLIDFFPTAKDLRGNYQDDYEKDKFDSKDKELTRKVNIKTIIKYKDQLETKQKDELVLELNKYLSAICRQQKETLINMLNFVEPIFNIKIYSLNLSGENLTYKIPKAVFLMEDLQELILHNNQITEISKDIRHLKKLKLLDLQNNMLEMLPQELLQLPNLKKVDLRGNPRLRYHDESQKIIHNLKDKGVKVKTN